MQFYVMQFHVQFYGPPISRPAFPVNPTDSVVFVNADRRRSDLGSAVRLFTATFTDAFSSLSALSHTGSNHRGIQCRTTYARTIAHTILYDTRV